MQAVHASTAYNLCMCTWTSVLHACTPADSCDIQDIPFRLSCPSVWGQISTNPPPKKSRKMFFVKIALCGKTQFYCQHFFIHVCSFKICCRIFNQFKLLHDEEKIATWLKVLLLVPIRLCCCLSQVHLWCNLVFWQSLVMMLAWCCKRVLGKCWLFSRVRCSGTQPCSRQRSS